MGQTLGSCRMGGQNDGGVFVTSFGEGVQYVALVLT
jgi:hypothetical protein